MYYIILHIRYKDNVGLMTNLNNNELYDKHFKCLIDILNAPDKIENTGLTGMLLDLVKSSELCESDQFRLMKHCNCTQYLLKSNLNDYDIQKMLNINCHHLSEQSNNEEKMIINFHIREILNIYRVAIPKISTNSDSFFSPVLKSILQELIEVGKSKTSS